MASKRDRIRAGKAHINEAIRALDRALRKAEGGNMAGARYELTAAADRLQKADAALHETLPEFLERNRRELVEMGLIPKEARDGR